MSKEKLYNKIKDSSKTIALDISEEPNKVQSINVHSERKRISEAFYIPIEKIKPPKISLREEIKKDKDFKILVSSIRNNKIIEPLVVYYNEEDDFYYIIIGSRRFFAAKEAGLDKVPCLIRKEKPDDKDILIEALIENIHRKNLNAFEEANVYQILINEYGYTQTQIMEEFGKPKSRISEILKIDLIPENVKEKVTVSEISREHLVEIARQKNEDDMLLLAREITEKKLNIQ